MQEVRYLRIRIVKAPTLAGSTKPLVIPEWRGFDYAHPQYQYNPTRITLEIWNGRTPPS